MRKIRLVSSTLIFGLFPEILTCYGLFILLSCLAAVRMSFIHILRNQPFQ